MGLGWYQCGTRPPPDHPEGYVRRGQDVAWLTRLLRVRSRFKASAARARAGA